ncbi:MAG: hypothetical protein MUO73_07070, partial [Thermoplasmata archaeon]|nr:hypothetical protein [Thermoplasmata archaeon]
MKKYILVIALIALVLCVITPVQAWKTGSNENGFFGVNGHGAGSSADMVANPNISLPADFEFWSYIYEDQYPIYFTCHNNKTSPYISENWCINTVQGSGYSSHVCTNVNPPDCHVGDILDITTSSEPQGSHHMPWWDIISGIVVPVASFSCTPTSQYPNQNVVCTDTSTNTPTSWSWLEGINGQPQSGWKTATSQNYTFSESYPALYSVYHSATNSAGTSWYNLTDYISITNNATPNTCNSPVASGYIRSMFQCVDSQTNGAISGCALSLKDQEGNAWSNTSSAIGGTHCIDTLPLHHVSGYGSASGYSSTYRTDLIASDTVLYELIMIPGYVPNAT